VTSEVCRLGAGLVTNERFSGYIPEQKMEVIEKARGILRDLQED
jgi:hypothetical protein